MATDAYKINLACCDCINACAHADKVGHYYCPKHAGARMDKLIGEARLGDYDKLFIEFINKQRVMFFMIGLTAGLLIAVIGMVLKDI